MFKHLNMFRYPHVFLDKDPDAGGAGGGGGGGEDDPPKDPPADPTVQLAQKELDKQFADRAKRGGESALSKLFEKYGVKDADELAAVIQDGKKLKESQMSELEKAQAEKEAAEKLAADEKTARETERAALTNRLMKAEVKAQAKAAGFRDESLQDVWMLVQAEHRDAITEKDDEFEGIGEVVEEIKKSRAFWLADPEKPNTPGTPKGQKKVGDGTPTPALPRKRSTL